LNLHGVQQRELQPFAPSSAYGHVNEGPLDWMVMHHRHFARQMRQQSLRHLLKTRRRIQVGMRDVVEGDGLRHQIPWRANKLMPGLVAANARQRERYEADAHNGMLAGIQASGLDIERYEWHFV